MSSEHPAINLTAQTDISVHGSRLDQAIAILFPEYSRSKLKTWILQGAVSVNGKVCITPKHKLLGFERIEIHAVVEVQVEHEAQSIALDVVFEDDDILVINKPSDLVVHPGAGKSEGLLITKISSSSKTTLRAIDCASCST